MKKLLLLAALVLWSSLLWAQTTVSGTVTDADNGDALEGVAVVVKGTTIGILTDAEGKYRLQVPDDATILMFTYVGMKTEEVAINGRTSINVELREDVLSLDEVVVTAIGLEANKRSVGYAVQNVDAQDLVNSRETNLVNALSSKVAGVTVVSSSGSPGASSNIRIRGSVSINGSNDPLFVVDGIPVDNSSSLNDVDGVDNSNRAIDINPNDIESLTVLKGPAATALYGLRAANGAIIITTKSGQKGKPQITFSASYTNDVVNKLPERQSTYAQGRPDGGAFVYNDPLSTDGFSWGPAIADLEFDGATDNPYDMNGNLVPKGTGNGNPAKAYDVYDFFKTGNTSDINLSVKGGTDDVSYYVSAGRLNSTGIVPNSTFARNSFRTRIQAQLSKKLSIGMSANYVNSGGNRLQRGSNLRGIMLGLLRNTPTFDTGNGKIGQEAADDPSSYVLPDGSQRSYRVGIYDNPYWVVNKNATRDDVNRIIGYTSLRYEFNSWLSASYKVGIDQFTDERLGHIDVNPSPFGFNWSEGSVMQRTQTSRSVNSDLLIQINKNISNDLTFNATLGHNYYATKAVVKRSDGAMLSVPNFYHISNASNVNSLETINQKRIVGVLGTANLSYKSYLFLNVSARNDWSSALPVDNNSFFAPAASVGFAFTEALGMQDNKILPYGKVRLSWGQVGLDAPIYSTSNYFNAAFNGGDGFIDGLTYPAFGTNAFERDIQLGNSNIMAELTTTFEIGGEFKFLNGRLGLDVTYYDSKSEGQIIAVTLPASTGFTNAVLNAGVISNSGWEIVFDASPVRSRDFRWDISTNFTTYKNTVDSLAEGIENVFLAGFTSTSSRVIAGQPYGAIYGDGFQKDDNGNTIIDANGWPLQDPVSQYRGDPNPDWIAGIRNTFSYKGITLSALIDVRQGGQMWCGTCGVINYFGTSQLAADERETGNGHVFEGVKEDGTTNTTPVNLADAANGLGGLYRVRYGFGGLSEQSIYETSWVRLRELTLSYVLPNSIVDKIPGVAGAQISFSGRNLWLSTDYPGIDPETNLTGSSNGIGLDYFNNPNTKSYGASLNVTF